jgi:hypothetical protein
MFGLYAATCAAGILAFGLVALLGR